MGFAVMEFFLWDTNVILLKFPLFYSFYLVSPPPLADIYGDRGGLGLGQRHTQQ